MMCRAWAFSRLLANSLGLPHCPTRCKPRPSSDNNSVEAATAYRKKPGAGTHRGVRLCFHSSLGYALIRIAAASCVPADCTAASQSRPPRLLSGFLNHMHWIYAIAFSPPCILCTQTKTLHFAYSWRRTNKNPVCTILLICSCLISLYFNFARCWTN